MLYGKRDFVDIINVTNQSKREDYPVLSRQAQCYHVSSWKQKAEAEVESEKSKALGHAIAGFVDGGDLIAN